MGILINQVSPLIITPIRYLFSVGKSVGTFWVTLPVAAHSAPLNKVIWKPAHCIAGQFSTVSPHALASYGIYGHSIINRKDQRLLTTGASGLLVRISGIQAILYISRPRIRSYNSSCACFHLFGSPS